MANKSEQMASSDFNMEKLSTKELGEHISATIRLGGNIAIFGRRGSGKTEISKQQIKESGMKEVYMNLSVLERTDMGGYPNIMAANQQKKFVDFLLPQFYQSMVEGGQGVVALLDEVDKADSSLWAPLLEFTQSHSINGTKLPGLQAVIMTGNLLSEGGLRPSPPLLDRAEKYLVEPDVNSWLEWAGKDGDIHPSITAYIFDHPKDLFGAVDPEDRYSDPSPRGWARASAILRKGETFGWGAKFLNNKVCGCVGKDVGIKYSNYYEHYQQLIPLVDKIFNDVSVTKQYNELEPSKKLVACMIVCNRLANKIDAMTDDANDNNNKETNKSIEYVGKFLKKVTSEMRYICMRSQLQFKRIYKANLLERDNWKEIIEEEKSKIGI